MANFYRDSATFSFCYNFPIKIQNEIVRAYALKHYTRLRLFSKRTFFNTNDGVFRFLHCSTINKSILCDALENGDILCSQCYFIRAMNAIVSGAGMCCANTELRIRRLQMCIVHNTVIIYRKYNILHVNIFKIVRSMT